MKFWKTVSDFFPGKLNRYRRELRLARAYRTVFPDRLTEDHELVLADMAFRAKATMAIAPDVTDAELRHIEGMREMYWRTRSFLNLSPEDMAAIENAARREAALSIENLQDE